MKQVLVRLTNERLECNAIKLGDSLRLLRTHRGRTIEVQRRPIAGWSLTEHSISLQCCITRLTRPVISRCFMDGRFWQRCTTSHVSCCSRRGSNGSYVVQKRSLLHIGHRSLRLNLFNCWKVCHESTCLWYFLWKKKILGSPVTSTKTSLLSERMCPSGTTHSTCHSHPSLFMYFYKQ